MGKLNIAPQEATAEDPNKGKGGHLSEPVHESSVADLALNFEAGLNKQLYALSGIWLHEMWMEKVGLLDEDRTPGVVKNHLGLNFEPRNSAERVAQRAGADTAIGVLTAGQSLMVSTATKAAPMAAKMGEKVVASMMEATRNSPFVMSLAEMAGFSGSGASAQAAKEGGASPAMQAWAGIAGGAAVAAPLSLLKFSPTWQGIKFLYNSLKQGIVPGVESGAKRRAIQGVARALKSGIGDESDMNESFRFFEHLGIKKMPSVAEASGSPQLLATQKDIETKAFGAELDNLVARKVDLVNGIKEASVRVGPSGDEFVDPEIITTAAATRLSGARATAAEKIAVIENELSGVTAQIPETNRVAVGAGLRELRDSLKEGVKTEFKALADSIGLNENKALFDIRPLKAAFKETFFSGASKLGSKRRAAALKDLNALMPDKEGMIRTSFDDIAQYRTRLNDEISEALVSGKSGRVRELVTAKGMLDDFIKNAEPAGVNPEQWRQFRSDYFEKFVQRFEQGTAYKIGQKGKQGTYLTNDEAVAGAFLRDETSVHDFFRLYQDNPEALNAMRSSILDEAAQKAVIEGVVDEKKLAAYLHANKKVLEGFPNVVRDLSNTRDAVRTLSAREAVLRSRAATIEKSALAKIVAKGGDINGVVDDALRSPASMRALVRTAESQGLGRRPVASLIWERAITHIGEGGIPSPVAIKNFIETNAKTLRIGLGEEHVKYLESIYGALEVTGRTPMPKGQPIPSGIMDQIERATGSGAPQISSRIFAANSGRVGTKYVIVDFAARLFNRYSKEHADILMRQALFDPDIAKDLSKFAQAPAPIKAIEKRLNGYLFNMGIVAVNDESRLSPLDPRKH